MKSYLRFLSRNKLYTAFEVVGLSISLAFVLFTAVFAYDIYTKTWIYPEHRNIYALNGLGSFYAPYEMSRYLDEIPQIKEHSEISHSYIRVNSEKKLQLHQAYAVSESFLKMFPKKFIAGNPESLTSAETAVITESLAKSIFGGIDAAMGKPLELTNLRQDQRDTHVLTVTGIIEDYAKEIFTAEVLVGIDTPAGRSILTSSAGAGDQIFVNVGEDIAQEDISEQVHGIIRRHFLRMEETIAMLGLEDSYASKLDELYRKYMKNGLKGGQMQDILSVMILISLALLASAILNYINLSFAQTSRRSNSLATMRLVGADRRRILISHLGESLTMSGVCAGLAVLIAFAAAPMARKLMNLDQLDIAIGVHSVVILVCIVFIVGVVAGLAPAFMALSYSPIEVTKGSFRKKRKMILAKIFICVQHTLATTLLVVACCIGSDIYARANEPMGINNTDIGIIGMDGEKYKEVLMELPCVRSIGQCNKIFQGGPGEYLKVTSGPHVSTDLFICDTAAFRAIGFQIRQDFHTDLHRSLWISERLMETLGLTVNDVESGNAGDIFESEQWADTHFGGIIDDFGIATTDYQNPGRLVLIDSENPSSEYMVLEISGDREAARRSIIEAVEKYASESPEGIFSLAGDIQIALYPDEYRNLVMANQNNLMSIVRLFMIISIFISILGMVGMSSYYADENTRSIAIHKIHGGTVRSETTRNIRLYMLLAAIASLIGAPLGLYIVKTYLNDYTFMNLSYTLPTGIAVVATFAFAFVAVFWQTLWAARVNPAEALKKE